MTNEIEEEESPLWTEEYRPKSLKEIQGSPGNIKNIKEWANAFAGGKKPRFPALIMSGPPGTGKTSTAIAVANAYDWIFTEFNASDLRTHDKLIEEALPIVTTQSVQGKIFRKLVLFDEIDSLHNNAGKEDKTASRAILKILEYTKHPIIFTCNDLYAVPKEIQDKCVLVKWQKVREGTIRKVLVNILEKEKITRSIEDVNKCIAPGDLRASISNLQAMTMADDVISFNSSAEITHFDLIQCIFRCDDLKKLERYTSEVHMNPEELILWVTENVTLFYKGLEIVRALDELCKADIYLQKARETQDYSYWRIAILHITKGVALSRIRPISTDYRKIQFPAYLKVMSSTKHKRRVLTGKGGLASKLGQVYHMSGLKMMANTFPLLQKICLINPSKLLELKIRLDLNEKEVAYLLDTTETDPRVKRLMNPEFIINDEAQAIIKRQEEKEKPLLNFFR